MEAAVRVVEIEVRQEIKSRARKVSRGYEEV